MPSQSARTLVLLCVVMGLVGSLGLVSGYAAGDRAILEHIAIQTHHDERLEDTEVHIVVRGGQVVFPAAAEPPRRADGRDRAPQRSGLP